MINILTPLFIVTSPLNVGQMIQDVRNWEAEQNRTPAEESINSAIDDLWEDTEDGSNGSTESRKSCYNFRVTKIVKVLDGDTIDVLIDLGFDLYKKERVRIAGVDTPEKRTRDLEEKELGIHATNWMKDKLTETIKGDEELTIRTELKGGVGKYGRLLGWLYVGDATVSLNEQMITEGYAWAYDGGTKQKNFEELREIRRSFGTLVE